MKTLLRFIASLALASQLYAADLTLSAGLDAFLVTPSSANFATAVSGETGTGALVFGTAPVFLTNADIEATGVRFTASNGSLTLLGLGDGADESLKLDFNTTTNTLLVTSASGVTLIDMGSIGLTVGDISGGALTVTSFSVGGVAITASGAELNFVDGVTSAIQTQLNAKVSNTVFDAAGDLLIGTGADTSARLAISAVRGAVLGSDGATAVWFNPRKYVRFEEEFFVYNISISGMTESGMVSDLANTGTITTVGTAANPGVFSLNISTSASSRAGTWSGTALDAVLFGGGEVYLEALVKVSALSDATDTYIIRCGMLDTRGDANSVDGIYFRYTHSVNSGNWEGVTRSNSVETVASGGTAGAPSTSFQKLGILINAAGTLVTFYLDDVSMGTSATNIPTAAGRETGIGGAFITRTAGTTTARSFSIDYYRWYQNLTTTR